LHTPSTGVRRGTVVASRRATRVPCPARLAGTRRRCWHLTLRTHCPAALCLTLQHHRRNPVPLPASCIGYTHLATPARRRAETAHTPGQHSGKHEHNTQGKGALAPQTRQLTTRSNQRATGSALARVLLLCQPPGQQQPACTRAHASGLHTHAAMKWAAAQTALQLLNAARGMQ
jgi:hypothetical protein